MGASVHDPAPGGDVVPDAHGVHPMEAGEEYVFAAHGLHLIVPAPLAYVPALHATHSVIPRSFAEKPAAQGWHSTAPALFENEPSAHGLQLAAPAAANVPATHSTHLPLDGAVPAAHFGSPACTSCVVSTTAPTITATDNAVQASFFIAISVCELAARHRETIVRLQEFYPTAE